MDGARGDGGRIRFPRIYFDDEALEDLLAGIGVGSLDEAWDMCHLDHDHLEHLLETGLVPSTVELFRLGRLLGMGVGELFDEIVMVVGKQR